MSSRVTHYEHYDVVTDQQTGFAVVVNDRRPRKLKTGKASIPNRLRWEVWERDDFRCKYCGVRRYLTIDHIIPEFHGGTTALENLQTLCSRCNSQKHVKQESAK